MPALWESTDTKTKAPDTPRAPGDHPLDLVLAVLAVAGFLLLAPSSLRREAAFEDAQLRAHQARLEQHQPGALARLRALAADLSTFRK